MRKLCGAVLAIALLAVAGCNVIGKSLSNRYCTQDLVERPYAVQPQTIAVDGVNIAYMEAGEGPNVIMVHGGVLPVGIGTSFTMIPIAPGLAQTVLHAGAFATADSWNYNIKAIASAGFHVIALDLPGFGASDKPDLEYKLEEFTTFLDGFVKAKGIDHTTLIGHGLGGEICILYALEHPEVVDRMVLVDSFGSYGKRSVLSLPRWAGLRFFQKQKAGETQIASIALDKIFDRWDAPVAGAFYFALSERIDKASTRGKMMIFVDREEPHTKEFIESVITYKKEYVKSKDFPLEVEATHKALMETHRKDLAPRFKEIKVPVMIIHGYYDPLVSLEEARYFEFGFPRAILAHFDNSGHYPMIEEADRFNGDMIMFLSAKNFIGVKEQAK